MLANINNPLVEELKKARAIILDNINKEEKLDLFKIHNYTNNYILMIEMIGEKILKEKP